MIILCCRTNQPGNNKVDLSNLIGKNATEHIAHLYIYVIKSLVTITWLQFFFFSIDFKNVKTFLLNFMNSINLCSKVLISYTQSQTNSIISV